MITPLVRDYKKEERANEKRWLKMVGERQGKKKRENTDKERETG